MSHALIRWAAGSVFIISGLMKLLNTGLADFFINLGLPFPGFMLYAVASTELICGGLIIANRFVKLAVIPLIGIMIAAVMMTKLPLLPAGLLEFAFESRLDVTMLLLLAWLYREA